MQIKFYLDAEERFSKKLHFLKRVRSQGQPTSPRVSHCSGTHAITFYQEGRGKHVLMEHSEDCLSSRKSKHINNNNKNQQQLNDMLA